GPIGIGVGGRRLLDACSGPDLGLGILGFGLRLLDAPSERCPELRERLRTAPHDGEHEDDEKNDHEIHGADGTAAVTVRSVGQSPFRGVAAPGDRYGSPPTRENGAPEVLEWWPSRLFRQGRPMPRAAMATP